MRAIWKGAVAFGLVNVPVRLYSATGEHEVTLHQVHKEDGGRIRYRKFCSIDDEPVEMSDIAKGYETDDGELVVLTDEDFASLPAVDRARDRGARVRAGRPGRPDPAAEDVLPGAREDRGQAVRAAARGARAGRPGGRGQGRAAPARVDGVLRVRDNVIVMQTLLWPDEVRAADFPVLDDDVSVRPQELAMAASLVESLAADFDPSQYEDRYAGALEQLIEAKVVLRKHPCGAGAHRARRPARGRRRRRRPAGGAAAQRREGARRAR